MIKAKILDHVPAIVKEPIVWLEEVAEQKKAGVYAKKPSLGLQGWNSLMAILVICLVCCFSAQAQESNDDDYDLKKNKFRVGVGVGYFKMADFQFSPNLFKSVRENLQLGYSNRFKKGIFTTNLNVFLGTVNLNSGSEIRIYGRETDIYGVEKIETKELELSQLGFNLEIGYVHRLSKLAASRTIFYLGGSVEECLTYTPGFLSVGTINYGSVNAKAKLDYFLGNGKPISFGFSIPVVSVVTRFPYHNAPNYPGKSPLAGFFTDNNNLESLNHFQNIRFSAKYNWLVRKRIAFDITYEASWMHYSRPEHLTQMGSQLSLGFNF